MAKVELPRVNVNQLKQSTLRMKSINTTVLSISKILGKKSSFVEKKQRFQKDQKAKVKAQKRKADEVASLKVEKKEKKDNRITSAVKKKAGSMLDGIINAVTSIFAGWLAGKIPEIVQIIKDILPRVQAIFDGITKTVGRFFQWYQSFYAILWELGKSLITRQPPDSDKIRSEFEDMFNGWDEMFRSFGNGFNAIMGREFEDPEKIKRELKDGGPIDKMMTGGIKAVTGEDYSKSQGGARNRRGSGARSRSATSSGSGRSTGGGGDAFAKRMIKVHEGKRLDVYLDSRGFPTVGYGHLIDSGSPVKDLSVGDTITQAKADELFDEDYEHHKKFAEKISGFAQASGEQKAAVIDLTFNMGPAWADGFPAFKKAFAAGDYETAGNELVNSAWYGQVGRRAPTIVSLVKGRGIPQGSYLGAGDGKPKTQATQGYLQAVAIGKMLNAQGIDVWQHPDFNVDTGYTGSGQERVMRRSYNSYHNYGEAIDIPLMQKDPASGRIVNAEKRLDQIAAMLGRNKKKYGIAELKWKDDANHFDHIHVSFKGSGEGGTLPQLPAASVSPAPSSAPATAANVSSAGDFDSPSSNMQDQLYQALLSQQAQQPAPAAAPQGTKIVSKDGGGGDSTLPMGTLLNSMQRTRLLTALAYT